MNKKSWWWHRKTISALAVAARHELEQEATGQDPAPMAADESLHLVTLSVVEIFSPSTMSVLIDAVSSLPLSEFGRNEALRRLTSIRRNHRHLGPLKLCTAVPAGEPVTYSDYFRDESLPCGVTQASVTAHSLSRSATVLTVSFRLTAKAGDLSDIQKRDYDDSIGEISVRPRGRFAQLRGKFKWTRPKEYHVHAESSFAYFDRQADCRGLIDKHERACANWAAARFPGRMSKEPFADRPLGRTFALGEFSWKDGEKVPLALGIWQHRGIPPQELWVPQNPLGWNIVTNGVRGRPHTITAFRKFEGYKAAEIGATLLAVTRGFEKKFDDYMARCGLIAILALQQAEFIAMRDNAALNTDAVVGGPAHGSYQRAGGVDTVTLAAEIAEGDDLPTFYELDQRLLDQEESPSPSAWPILVAIQGALRQSAGQLLSDYTTTMSTLSSYSQLVNASINTKLQRQLFWIAILAIFVSVASLVTALVVG